MADSEELQAKEGDAGQAKRATTEAALAAPQVADRLESEELDERDAQKLPTRRAAGPPRDETVPDDAEVPDVPAAELGEP